MIEATARADGGVVVRVSDNGRGLPAGDSRAIFEPFFTTKEDGLGMGLSISESIVEAHGGELTAEPSASGGATLHFTLPYTEQLRPASAPPQRGAMCNTRILIFRFFSTYTCARRNVPTRDVPDTR